MVLAQVRFSQRGQAVWGAVLMCSLFVLVGPFAWRLFFPPGGARTPWPLRLAAFAVLGSLPATLGWAFPHFFDLGETFLTAGINLFIAATLFWVGGWGLGRDIEMEEGLVAARARADALAREAERSQLLALRAHLDPHFLFNTLNAIAEWCREDGEVAEKAILRLSGLLRQVLAGVKVGSWPLARDLSLARDLLELHRVRDPDRFRVDWQVPETVPDVEIPPLLLLPLAENAMKHGPGRGHAGAVTVRVEEGDFVRVVIRNPGPYRPGSTGDGLSMVRKRLDLAWGSKATFTIGDVDGSTEAVVTLPRTKPEVA